MKRKIVVDSSSNLSRMQGIDFACVPLKIITDEQEYVDAPETDAFAMAHALRSYKGKSSTSCPNVGDFLAAYEGADEIFVVTITGTLSGCNNAARMAAEEYQDNHPGARVFVLDSLSTGPEMCLLARRMAVLAATDAAFDEICQDAEAYSQHTHLLFSLESLNNLARNGRVKLTAAVVARALGIRVLGQASPQGELDLICKTRGEHGVLERIILEMKAKGYAGGPVQIAHCDNENAARRLKLMIEAVWQNARAEIVPCGALCSFYAELGGLLVGYEDAKAPALPVKE
ncbi:fatty acid-binding protein DegV [Faecalibacterium sp. An58]|uniref:DegV family protein n=1 Tax=Faecalibacterium sp. An58 TaxID=1965648 RepID=UPI000B3A7547|nr:DegV family protein [Faecalibacterium sp. An58]OUN75685.1 fatty acid-binding protein DegV [Faecalibacterium sp. An58]